MIFFAKSVIISEVHLVLLLRWLIPVLLVVHVSLYEFLPRADSNLVHGSFQMYVHS